MSTRLYHEAINGYDLLERQDCTILQDELIKLENVYRRLTPHINIENKIRIIQALRSALSICSQEIIRSLVEAPAERPIKKRLRIAKPLRPKPKRATIKNEES